jgi:protein-disulfide isomerase
MNELDSADHVRGGASGRLILVYGDYQCPYTRLAIRSIGRVTTELGDGVRFAYRHFPLTEIHPHALHAALAAEAAEAQQQFWAMHDLLFRRQKALADADLRRYADELGLDGERFDDDMRSEAARKRVQRDIDSGTAGGEVSGTPTFFIDGRAYRGSYEAPDLLGMLR